jgi:hypothetical protein
MNGLNFEHTFLVCSIATEADGLIGMDLISTLRIVLELDQDTMTWCREQLKPRRGKVLTTTQRVLTIFSNGQDGRSPKFETPRDWHMAEQFPASPAMEAEKEGNRSWRILVAKNFTVEPKSRQIKKGRVDFGRRKPPLVVGGAPTHTPIAGIIAVS